MIGADNPFSPKSDTYCQSLHVDPSLTPPHCDSVSEMLLIGRGSLQHIISFIPSVYLLLTESLERVDDEVTGRFLPNTDGLRIAG